MGATDDRTDGLPFEKALERLEQIVAALEGDEHDLDRSLQLFEEGMTLVRRLEQQLERAEMRVEELLRNADGATTTAPLELDDGAPEENGE
ncbi:MAG: exodeoxyribonuclease VII small subunit [Acidobacteria bacterium]|nr:MAG: exodeoxyribonuclease VII small subunit [Acidobacteriota bacterium]